jgi:hypothetical protein
LKTTVKGDKQGIKGNGKERGVKGLKIAVKGAEQGIKGDGMERDYREYKGSQI